MLSGLIGLTSGQYQAAQRYSPSCDLLFACGDIVPILFARLTGRPFVVFLVSTSSYYEGRVKLPWLAQWGMKSPQCLAILTRDRYTAQDLLGRGFVRTQFLGYPIMDVLQPGGQMFPVIGEPLIALLPGSRLPEAKINLGLMLELCEAIAQVRPAQFRIALVPGFTQVHLTDLATKHGWKIETGCLQKGKVTVYYHYDAFADILHQCDLVVGMAGTAVEQAVGLGKPIIQIPGPGPQFTYLFAEAQMRLLGDSVVTIGTRPATTKTLTQAAIKIDEILGDAPYLKHCQANGRERVGEPGGSEAIAHQILEALNHLAKATSMV